MKNDNSNSYNLFVDIHALQNFPPSCVNRDDTGSPKSTEYGGVARSVMSSQCWKHAIRSKIKEYCPEENFYVQTRSLDKLVEKAICEQDSTAENDAEELAHGIVDACFGDATDKGNEHLLKAVVRLSDAEIKTLGKLALDKRQTVKNYLGGKNKKSEKDNADGKDNDDATATLRDKLTKEMVKRFADAKEMGLDVALSGRMFAKDAQLSIDAASMVAFPISTHESAPQFDYIAATDDRETNSAYLGMREYRADTMYRYASVDMRTLYENLQDKNRTLDALKCWLRAFIEAMPSGSIHTFANTTRPYFVAICIGSRPTSFVDAFENPVKPAEEGYGRESLNRLTKKMAENNAVYDAPGKTFYICLTNGSGVAFDGTNAETMQNLLEKTSEYVDKHFAWVPTGSDYPAMSAAND